MGLFGRDTWSAEALRAHKDARARDAYSAVLEGRMRDGPYYDEKLGMLCIPSCVWCGKYSRRANVEWRSRGLRYDGDDQEWRVRVAPEHAAGQVAAARAVYFKIFAFLKQGQGGAVCAAENISTP